MFLLIARDERCSTTGACLLWKLPMSGFKLRFFRDRSFNCATTTFPSNDVTTCGGTFQDVVRCSHAFKQFLAFHTFVSEWLSRLKWTFHHLLCQLLFPESLNRETVNYFQSRKSLKLSRWYTEWQNENLIQLWGFNLTHQCSLTFTPVNSTQVYSK